MRHSRGAGASSRHPSGPGRSTLPECPIHQGTATRSINAVAESFFATLKLELVDRYTWPTRRQARTAIFEFIEGFNNGQRRHSTLDYLSPAAFEGGYHAAASAA